MLGTSLHKMMNKHMCTKCKNIFIKNILNNNGATDLKPEIYSWNGHRNKLQTKQIIDYRRTPMGVLTRLRHNWQNVKKG